MKPKRKTEGRAMTRSLAAVLVLALLAAPAWAGTVSFGASSPAMNDSGTCVHPMLVQPAPEDTVTHLKFVGFPLSHGFWPNRFELTFYNVRRGVRRNVTLDVPEPVGTQYFLSAVVLRPGHFYRNFVRVDTLYAGPCAATRLVTVVP